MANITVINTNDSGSGSLRDAIATAMAGDTIVFDNSLANSTISLSSGELVINKNLTIQGLDTDNDPTTREITIDAQGNSPVFNIDDGNNTAFSSISISNLTITGGSTAVDGGGILNGESLSISNSTVSGNTAGNEGGGIFNRNQSTLSVTNSTVSGNIAGDDGGGITNSNQSTLSVTNSTVSGNTAGNEGGGIYSFLSALSVTNSTVSGNTARDEGGGIHIKESTLTLLNSTVSGNIARDEGGGIGSYNSTLSVINSTLSGNSAVDGGGIDSDFSTITITSSTVSGNTAGNEGGGIRNRDLTRLVTLTSTIVGGNISRATFRPSPDVSGGFADGGNNLIGDTTGGGLFDNPSTIVGQNPQLGPLQNNGGLTPTQALLPASPAINQGSNPNGLQFDQRGTGFPREVDGAPDIGAFEVPSRPTSLVVDILIDEDDNDITPGDVSLRDAIKAVADGGTVTFDNSIANGTINLDAALGELVVDKNLTIDGATENITVDAQGNSRVFNIDDMNVVRLSNVSISGLTITGGSITANGGGILNNESLSISNSTVSGNIAGTGGGGIFNSLQSTLSITDSTVSGNTAGNNGGGVDSVVSTLTLLNSTLSGNSAGNNGGGIRNFGSTLTLLNSTLSGNSAGNNGGGINSLGSTTTVTSTIIGSNIATASGPDVSGSFTDGGDNLIGDATGSTGFTTSRLVGDSTNPINPQLDPLQDNGGVTPTQALSFSSPAINQGSNPNGLQFDQRGTGFPREVDGAPDIGAFEVPSRPTSLVVDILMDEDDNDITPGDVSLRDAIKAVADGGTVTFANSIANGTINLDAALGELVVDKNLTIDGATENITVDAQGNSRVFNIDDGDTATFSNVSISGLTITGGSITTSGGGIVNNESLSISNSTVSGNSSGNDGGGIASFLATLSISNSTVSGNSSGNDGGGIDSYSSSLSVTNSTVAENVAANGGGINSDRSISTTVTSTIIASNTATNSANVDVQGTFSDSGNNLIGDATGSTGFTTSTLVGDSTNLIDPLLGPLQDNGGPTQTQALLPNSPAVNEGSNPNGLQFDQRGTGFPRVNDGAPDIGAFEYTNIPPFAADVGLVTLIDTATNVNLFARDFDPDGTINPATYDLDPATAGQQTSFTVAEGSFTINPQGILTFTPNAGFTGAVTPIQYTVQDNLGAISNAANVTVNVSAVPNQPPQTDNVFAPPPPIPGDAVQAPLSVPLSGTDPDGTVVSFQITKLPTGGDLFLNGNAVTAGQMIDIADAGNLSVTPNLGFSGGFITFEYEAIDNQGANDLTPALYKAVVAPIDRPPQTQNLTGTVQQANPPVSGVVPTLTGTDSDGTVDNFRLTSLPSNGTLLLNGNTVDTTTLIPITEAGNLSLTPNSGFTGDARFGYVAIDNQGKEDPTSATITITVTPAPNTDPQTDDHRSQVVNSSLTGVTLTPSLSGTDADGTVDQFRIITLPSSGTLEFNGNAIAANDIINATNEAAPLTYNPDPALPPGVTDFTFTYAAIDNQNAEDQTPATYTIPVQGNNPPVANTVAVSPIDNTATDVTLNPPPSGTDPDGTVASFTITQLPPATEGVVSFSGNAVNVGDTLSPTEVTTLTFTPDTNFAGNTSFSYTVTDNDGAVSNEAQLQIPVQRTTPPNLPPTVNSLTLQPTRDVAAINIPLLPGNDPEGGALTFEILSLANSGQLLLNGTPVTVNQTLNATEAGQLTLSPTVGFTGNVSFTYTATDPQGLTASPNATVTIPIQANQLPIANTVTVPVIDNTVTDVTLNPPASGTDPDGTVASFTITQLPPATEGVVSFGGNAVNVGDTFTPAEIATLTFTPDTNFAGNTSFSYTVTDNDGAVSNEAQLQIPVQSATAPVDLPPTVNSINVNPIANDITQPAAIPDLEGTDPEDGNPTSFTITTLPSNGQLLLNGNPATLNQIILFADRGNLTYDPDNTFTGTDSFEYIGTDSQGVNSLSSATVSIPVNPGNQPPVADTITTNTLVSTDPNTPLTPGLSATDPENDPVTFTITQLPAASEGELLVNGTTVTVGQILDATEATQLSFTPNSSFSGTSVVEYTATDNQGNTSTNIGQLQIPIQGGTIDLPPTVNSINVNPIANDITQPAAIPDLDGTDPEDGNPTSFTITTLPSNGQLLLNGNPATLNQVILFADRGNLTYDPDNTFTGTDSFEYIGTDSQGVNSLSSATVSIPVNPGNQPPSAANKISAPIDNSTTNAAVPDLTGSDPEDGTVNNFRINQLPNSGQLLLNGNPFTDTTQILTATEAASLTYNPDTTFNGNASFQYVAVDTQGLESASATVTLPITSANLPPVPVNLISPQIPNSATDVIVPTLTATDPDGDAISEFTITNLPSSGILELNGTAIAVGDTIPFAEAGNLTYTPDPNFNGDVNFTYTATDAQGLASSQTGTVTLPVTIGNLPPIPVNASTTTEGTTPVAVPTLTATDPDGDAISEFTITQIPASGIVELNDTALTVGDIIPETDASNLIYTANTGFVGIDNFDFLATDNRGAISVIEGDITFNVTPQINQPPIADDLNAPIVINNGSIFPLPALSATDPDGTINNFSITTLPNSNSGTLLLGTIPVNDLNSVSDLSQAEASNLNFTAQPGFIGDSLLNYTATDNSGAISNEATLLIPVVAESLPPNQPPIAENIDIDNIPNNGTAVDIPPLDATDSDGQVVSYRITQLPTAEQGQLLLAGSVVTDLNEVDALSPEQINQLSYIPNPNFSGQFSLTYTATDNDGATSNRANINFNVPNTSEGGGENPDIEELCDCTDVPDFASFGVSIPVISDVIDQFPNVIVGTEESEVLVGTEVPDAILGAGGNDSISGEGDNDLIDGGADSDLVFGVTGNDTLIGDGGDAASAGDDAIVGNTGNDVMTLNAGEDTLYGGQDDDFGYGGQDNDLMFGDVGNDTLFGDRGDDTLLGDRDIPNSNELEGQDILWGGEGNDFIDGNTNNDTLGGGVGEDTVRGGRQNDLVFGEEGDDLVYGDLGDDEVVGNDGADTLYGGTGNNTVLDFGQDKLCGGAGNDLLFGEGGRDVVCGDDGNDTLYGGSGSDTLIGGDGEDLLFGDSELDTLFGGEGSDGFVLDGSNGSNVILDFSDGEDLLRLSGVTFEELTISQDATGTVIELGTQRLATLEGINVSQITEDDFASL